MVHPAHITLTPLCVIVGTAIGTPALADDGPDPCAEAQNQIWSIDDKASFEAVESQVRALQLNTHEDERDEIDSFPDLGDC